MGESSNLNSNFNTDFNPTSALLEAGIQQIETENALFVGQMQTSMDHSKEAYELQYEAHDKRRESAMQTAVAEGVQAGSSLAAGGTSIYGGVSMNQQRNAAMNPQLVETTPNPANPQQTGQQAVGGSQEFQDNFNAIEQNVNTLTAERNTLGAKQVDTTDANGNTTVKPLSEVTEAEYNQWQTERADIQSRIDGGDDSPEAALRLQELDGYIGDYDRMQQIDGEIGWSRKRQNDLVNGEKQGTWTQTQMLTGTMQMKYSGMADIIRGLLGATAAPLRAWGTATGVEADEYNTEAEWNKERSSAARSLGEQFLSGSKSKNQYMLEAIQAKQSATQKIATVQA